MHAEQALRARAKQLASIYWHHSIRLFPDLLTKGGKSESLLEAERAAILGPLDLSGREVLDIGSWNGYFAFEAKRAGAARVIASDSLCWSLPMFRGRETFDLARECLGLDIETKTIDPTELPGDIAPVDVVLFLGVFYHMHDPIAVLKATAALAREALVIETHQDLLDLARPGMAFYPRATLYGDESNWWGPNPECMFELLESIGWPQVHYQPHPVVGAGRGIYHAFRDADTARRLFRGGPQVHDLRTREGQSAAFAQPPSAGATPKPAAGRGSWRRWLGGNRA
jgi:tRNA (mo5U34)-methyltransferase